VYKVKTYYGDPKNTSVVYIDYFNIDSQLVGKETRDNLIKYYYNDAGNVYKSQECRRGQCRGRWTYEIFDEHGNSIGNVYTNSDTIDFDTITFDQTRFYDGSSNLTKEVTFKSDSVAYISTHEYDASNHRIRSVEFLNQDTVWVGLYLYNDTGNLNSVHKIKDGFFYSIRYTYNSHGRIDSIIHKSNRPIEIEGFQVQKITFDNMNKIELYSYDSDNRLISERTIAPNGTTAMVKYLEYDK
jgi:hypothetical protein